MTGTFSVVAPAPPPPPPPPPPPVSAQVTLTRIGTFRRPVLVTAPADDERLFVVEQTGAVRVIRDGVVLSRPFLDLKDDVKLTSESGLLSLAFAPDYERSGLLYLFYNTNAGNGDIRVAEWRRHATDPDLTEPFGERVVLTITKPWENHNGGMLQFGPDGNLFISVGDGDSGVLTRPGFFAQRLDSLLGKVLRIDPRGGEPYVVPVGNPFVGIGGARPEIWAYGLRNPWRFWIDHDSGAMLIGDVGEQKREEVDFVERGVSGLNFGWPCFEGTLPFDSTSTCDRPVAPLFDFPREDPKCALIGGVVVRDSRVPGLAGRYLYGDLCTGRITAVEIRNGVVTDSDELDVFVPRLTSFGVDGVGRVYATSLDGDVFRLDSRSSG
jgi:glucose/arabinose dehydrogenase